MSPAGEERDSLVAVLRLPVSVLPGAEHVDHVVEGDGAAAHHGARLERPPGPLQLGGAPPQLRGEFLLPVLQTHLPLRFSEMDLEYEDIQS